jgi:hypothetical protein
VWGRKKIEKKKEEKVQLQNFRLQKKFSKKNISYKTHLDCHCVDTLEKKRNYKRKNKKLTWFHTRFQICKKINKLSNI